MRAATRWVVVVITTIHGLIHLIGVGRASTPWLWALAATLMVTTAVAMVAAPRRWWPVGVVAAGVSQVAILTSWATAGFGTVANLVVLAAALHSFAAEGPWGLRARYRLMTSGVAPSSAEHIVGEHDLSRLPSAVAEYVRRSGAIGLPVPAGFRAAIRGRIRGGVDQPWMSFTGQQMNTFAPTFTRSFFIDATMRGAPVDVLHSYVDGVATMDVRAVSLLPIVHAEGTDMNRAETVTVFNDLCVMAPAALLDAPVTWSVIDDDRVRATFSTGGHTISAELQFNADGDLVDFVSDDRLRASANGRTFTPQRWSTPLGDMRLFHLRRLPSSGDAMWHAPPPEGTFSYLEFELVELHDLDSKQPGGNGASSPDVAGPPSTARAA